MSGVYTHSVFSAIPEGLFDSDNIEFIRKKVMEILGWTYRQKIVIDRASVIRILQRVLYERNESIPRMNERAIMYIVNDFQTHQAEVNKNLKLESHYKASQLLYDASTERSSVALYNIKLANRLGRPKVGGTQRFWFI